MPTAPHQVLSMCCSAFFRPPQAFAALEAWVVEDLWVPACGAAALRECVVFATHDLMPDNRTQLYSLLHFALNEGGHLLLRPDQPLLRQQHEARIRAILDATAAENKALQQEIIDVATLEQRRIGQELHDGTQQELTGLGLLALSLAETLGSAGSAAASQAAARIARGIEQCNQRVRSLARGMVPVSIDREGLMAALAELARQTTEIHGLPCGFECPAPVEIDNDNEATHLYRIAQEAVNNATRHARASAIWIRLEQARAELLLQVRDNGIGLQARGVSSKGVGLRLMEHRCAMIGGNFSVETQPDGGTSIMCTVARPQDGVS